MTNVGSLQFGYIPIFQFNLTSQQNQIQSNTTNQNNKTNQNANAGMQMILAGLDLIDDGQFNGSMIKNNQQCSSPNQQQTSTTPSTQNNQQKQQQDFMQMLKPIFDMIKTLVDALCGQKPADQAKNASTENNTKANEQDPLNCFKINKDGNGFDFLDPTGKYAFSYADSGKYGALGCSEDSENGKNAYSTAWKDDPLTGKQIFTDTSST